MSDFEEDDVDVSEAMTGDDMLVFSGEEMTADSSGRATTAATMAGETGASSNIQEDSQSSNYFANNYR